VGELARFPDRADCLYVVRGMEPAAALEVLGGEADLIRPCELPTGERDHNVSLPASVPANESGYDGTLLAGRIGAWTFVYDDVGLSDDGWRTQELSAGGNPAASAAYSINAVARLDYSVDGRELFSVGRDDLVLENALSVMPPELAVAFEDAGTFELDYLRPGEPDFSIFARVVCALADLRCTLEDLRRIPLLSAPY
jgi:hypothetical protein